MIPLEIAFLYFLTIYLSVKGVLHYNKRKSRLERLKQLKNENTFTPKL